MIHNRRACALITIGSLVTALTGLTTLAANAQPSGSIGADVTADVIHGSGFGSSATLTVQRGTTTESWTNGVSGPWDYNPDSDSFGLYLQGAWDVQPGDHVTVEGNGLVDAMTVTDVRVTGWQFADNVVSGTVAPSDNDFPIYLSVSHYSQQDPSTLVVQRNGVSGWSGDLDNVDTNESPPIHIRVNDSVEACQPDANANESCSDTVLAGPRFAFGVELQ